MSSVNMTAGEAFESRKADETVHYQNSLILRGQLGQIAFGLFRAQKRSTRAKAYRRGMRQNSYAAKNEALKYLDRALTLWGNNHGFTWGWKKDSAQSYHDQVLYVDVPGVGQCSFHAVSAASSKAYNGRWDQRFTSEEVVLGFCDLVSSEQILGSLSDEDLMPFGKHVGCQLGELRSDFWKWLSGWDGIRSWQCLHGYIQEKTGCGEFSVG